MSDNHIAYRTTREVPLDQILTLYRALDWSSAEKPEQLHRGLRGSHSLVTAWHGDRLVGLANAISDGHLVVYYPHLIVHPDYQKRGIGRRLMGIMVERYADFHQQVLVGDARALGFYEKCGFERAGSTQPMWIYQGHDHD